MFRFDYACADVKQKLCEYQKGGVFWDEMVEDELKPILQKLRETGEAISDVGINICGINHKITGRTFEIVYAVFPEQKFIKFYECNFLSQDIDWREIIQKSWNLSIGEVNLPQIGIKRIMLALNLIYQGHDTAYELGLHGGSKSKIKRYIARYGQYNAIFLKELGLIKIHKSKHQTQGVYECIEIIHSGLANGDHQNIQRLVAESLLGFPVIKLAIQETTKGEKELTIKLLQDIFKQLDITDCGGKTEPRRAQSVRGLINWVAREAGIPIRREGQKHLQGYLDFDIFNMYEKSSV